MLSLNCWLVRARACEKEREDGLGKFNLTQFACKAPYQLTILRRTADSRLDSSKKGTPFSFLPHYL